MFGISRKTTLKASIAALASMAVSLAAALLAVPLMGGHPDGPGFWMSVICPLVIAFPASAWQFHQHERLIATRNQLAATHAELDRMHNELKQTHASLQQQARHDAMTGALNREAFFALLAEAGRDERPGAVLIADADHFKRINDTHGHRCGDEALKSIAAAITAVLRPKDFWGRIGGEEFALYIEGADADDVGAIAERLRAAVETIELYDDDVQIPVTISIGGICLPACFDATSAVNEADRCLYAAKRAGRNCVVLSEAHMISGDSIAA